VKAIKIADGVYWVGAIDWNIRDFHGYLTPRGTTYNAYLVVDERVALVDTVKSEFFEEMTSRIESVVKLEDIDYVISNHVEMGHSGSIPHIAEQTKNVKVVCTERGKSGLLKHYHGEWDFTVVKTGNTLDLGKRSLSFIEAPMLHWPDSMFTCLKEDRILMPNDAFGQHIATSGRFDDEVPEALDEAAKYYANILMPFGSLIQAILKKLGELSVSPSIIAPSHGIVWHSSPGRIVEAYRRWSQGENESKVVIVYDSMWHSTEKMALAIVEGAAEGKVEVKLFNLKRSDWSEIVKEILTAGVVLLGTSTLNNTMLPTLGSFLTYLSGLRPKGKVVGCFGSYGWGGGGTRAVENQVKSMSLELMGPSLEVQYVPDKENLAKCLELGRAAASKLTGECDEVEMSNMRLHL